MTFQRDRVFKSGRLSATLSGVVICSPKHPSGLPAPLVALTPLTDDLDHALLHRRRVQAAVGGAPDDLVQQEMHEVLVGDEPPQVHLQVVAVHLDLLQPVSAEGAQADALQECLQTDFDDARHHGDLGRRRESVRGDRHRGRRPRTCTHLVELHGAEDVDALRKQLVYVAQQVGVHGGAASRER